MALALGYSHPDALLRELTSWQISEWLAYYNLEPFGEQRADLRAGIVASTVANANRDPKRQPYRPDEFMPKFGEQSSGTRRAAQSPEALLAQVVEINHLLGGDDLRSPPDEHTGVARGEVGG